MSGVNRVIVTGNLTRDPELRHTKGNVPLCDMRIAISTRVKDSDDICYIGVTAWDKQAESCSRFLKKGAWILIEGRLKLNEWETREGQKRSRIEIVAHRVVFLNAPQTLENTANDEKEIDEEG